MDLANNLADQGIPEDEINELLFYDPESDAYRVKRRRKGRGRRRGRSYDPGPRRKYRWRSGVAKRARGAGRKAKGFLTKLRPYVMPGTASITFYAAYTARAKALGTNPDTGKPHDVFSAIMYDLKNFDGNAAMERMKAKGAPILGAAVGGILVKKFAPGKLKMLGDVLTGIAVGQAGKVVLDPPVVAAPPAPPAIEAGGCPGCQAHKEITRQYREHDPFAPGGF